MCSSLLSLDKMVGSNILVIEIFNLKIRYGEFYEKLY